MKKVLKKGSALLLALIMVLSLAACGGKGNAGDASNEQVDDNRTQLYVYNFAGGFGAEWLAAAKERFEELHKDDV